MFTRFTHDLHRVYIRTEGLLGKTLSSEMCKPCANLEQTKPNSRQTNSYFWTQSAHGKLCFGISEPLCKPIFSKNSNITGLLQGPTWRKSRDGSVLLANRRYYGSRSRKTKGSLAETFQCNIWRRAQAPNRLTHRLHGGDSSANQNGFTALS